MNIGLTIVVYFRPYLEKVSCYYHQLLKSHAATVSSEIKCHSPWQKCSGGYRLVLGDLLKACVLLVLSHRYLERCSILMWYTWPGLVQRASHARITVCLCAQTTTSISTSFLLNSGL